MKVSGRADVIVVVAYLVFLTGFVGACYLVLGPVIAAIPLELRSRAFPSVLGTVTDSRVALGQVATRYGERGEAHAVIEVAYDVSGRWYRTRRLDFSSTDSSSLGTDASSVVARYPVGRSVTVYYDPSDPAVAALTPGVVWVVIAASSATTPLLLVVIGLLGLPFFAFRRREEREEPVSITETATLKRFHVHTAHWFLTGIAVSVPALFIAGCCGLVDISRGSRGIGLAVLVWSVELCIVVASMWHAASCARHGRWDVVIDKEHKRISFPAQWAFGAHYVVPMSDVERLSTEMRTRNEGFLRLVVHELNGREVRLRVYTPTGDAGARLVALLEAELSA